MGIFLGERSVMYPKIYEVVDLDQIPQKALSTSTIPSRPENLTLYVTGNDLFISWNPKA